MGKVFGVVGDGNVWTYRCPWSRRTTTPVPEFLSPQVVPRWPPRVDFHRRT